MNNRNVRIRTSCFITMLLASWAMGALAETGPRPGLIPGQGDQWPTWRGPLGNGQAIDCADALIDDLSKARVAWVSEYALPGPTDDCHTDCNVMGSPIVAEDRIYVFYYRYTDEVINTNAIAAYNKRQRPEKKIDPLDIAKVPSIFKPAVVDHLLAMDLKTGKTIWDIALPRKGLNLNNLNWAARMQHIYGDGRIYVTGTSGAVYGVDAKTGKVLWQSDFGEAETKRFDRCLELGDGFTTTSLNDDLSHAPAFIDRVVVIGLGGTGYAYDAATGSKLWTYPGMYGGRAVEVMAWHQEGHPPAFITPFGGRDPSDHRKRVLAAVDAHTGKQVWGVDIGEMKSGVGPMLARKNDIIVCAPQEGLAAVMVEDGKGRLLWSLPDVCNYRHQAPIIHAGHVFTFGDKGRDLRMDIQHRCFNLATGRTVALFDNMNRWRDHHAIFSNDRLYTFSGVIQADPKDYRALHLTKKRNTESLLPPAEGRLKPIIYMCPLIVDGRLIAHCSKRIVCWDLRAE